MTDPEPYPVAYLRVDEAELEEKQGWVKPGLRELREMLSLDDGSDGLDEAGREHLEALGPFQMKSRDSTEEEFAGTSFGVSSTSIRFAQTGRWFAASLDGCTHDDEIIDDEIRRSLDGIIGEQIHMFQLYF